MSRKLMGLLVVSLSLASAWARTQPITSDPTILPASEQTKNSAAIPAHNLRCQGKQATGGYRWHSGLKDCVDAPSGICTPLVY